MQLINAKTFIHDEMQEGETSTPVMEIFKVKMKSDGSLDELKTRLVVRGDLQSKTISEDTWSPTASFRSLKMFLAHACKNKLRVKQLDFIGAFLQANIRARIFVTIPKIFGILFPEYSEYCGIPLRLGKSMYGMTLSGKYWFLDLKEFLLQEGFTTSSTVKCLFYKVYENGDFILILDYVDDMLYHGSNKEYVIIFEKRLQARFNLELMGQAHWYLATRINQKSNFDIELDQTRYCLAILKKYLDSVGCPKNNSLVSTPLPLPFLPSSDDCSVDENAVATLEEEYNIEYASCIGSLIYLTMTRTDILFAVNKLAKISRSPGRVHFDVLIHLLRYLRDNVYLGIKFYSNFMEAPLLKSLSSQNIEQHHPFFCFSDSSWNDDPDTGRSTGCFIITYMGGVVDHSSNMPNPVALSSTESEYNEGCVAFMTASHLRMLLCVLEQISEEDMSPITIYFDSKSAIAMGSSYKDTKHTRHIERR
jgi:hypothetical protein